MGCKNISMAADPLKFWTSKQHVWPELTRMARQCLAMPATSAGVERMFSAAGRIFSDSRQAMLDKNLEAILFARANTD